MKEGIQNEIKCHVKGADFTPRVGVKSLRIIEY